MEFRSGNGGGSQDIPVVKAKAVRLDKHLGVRSCVLENKTSRKFGGLHGEGEGVRIS